MKNNIVVNYKDLSYSERINLARDVIGKHYFSYTDIAQATNKSVYKVKKELSDLSLLSVEVLRFLVEYYKLNKAYIFGNSEKMFAYYVDKYLDEITNRFYFKDELGINGEICFYGGGTQISCPIDCNDIQINPITGEVRGVLLAKFTTEDE